jgi:hypothetical protein
MMPMGYEEQGEKHFIQYLSPPFKRPVLCKYGDPADYRIFNADDNHFDREIGRYDDLETAIQEFTNVDIANPQTP